MGKTACESKGWVGMTAAKRKRLRKEAKKKGLCGECSSRPAEGEGSQCAICKSLRKDRRERKKAAKKELAALPREPLVEDDEPKELPVRLAKPGAEELCYCGKRVAFAGALFCVEDGRKYVADMMKRRIEP